MKTKTRMTKIGAAAIAAGIIATITALLLLRKKKMIKSLFVIGNGFDLHHGIPSSYSEFKAFAHAHNREMCNTLDEYFQGEFNWGEFEATLAYLDIEEILEKNEHLLTSYAADDWRDSDNHNYEFEIGEIIKRITSDLKTAFSEWVYSLPKAKIPLVKCIDPSCLFLNFNYTSTLEDAYRIGRNQILYIHNRSETKNSNLIIGHGKPPVQKKKTPMLDEDGFELYDEGDEDIRITNGNKKIEQYFKATYKRTRDLIVQNLPFFESLSSVQTIYVLGHSLSQVDHEYFATICAKVNLNNVRWLVSYYDPSEIPHKQTILTSMGVPASMIEFKKLTDL